LTGEAIEPSADVSPLLPDAIVLLQHSYRFGGDSGIGRLAEAVNRGDEAAIKTLYRQSLNDVCWYTALPEAAEQDLLERMLTGYRPYLQRVREQDAVAAIFAAFQDYQALCPQRAGPTGVDTLNALVETVLKARLGRSHSEWYPGRPIMITRNDYQLRLFNGDIGITLSDPDNEDRLRVYFQGSDGIVRSFPITRLPAYEPVFTMTIHKSQGSEFNEVLLVLPPEDSRVLTRELIYTGITRAKEKLAVWGSLDILLQAVRRPIQRASGLGEKLQQLSGNVNLAENP
jgi:exodeoxyribonuclease V alpha subunit